MPDAPAVPPAEPVTPASPAAATVPASAAVKKSPPGEMRTSIDDESSVEVAAPGPKKEKNILAIGLGILAGFLVIVVSLLWVSLNARSDALLQTQNRLDQIAAGSDNLQAQVTDARTDATAAQKKTEEAHAVSALDKADLVKADAASAEAQIQLTKARAAAVDFQAQMSQANVASLKHQGEVELARAETAVLQTQLIKAQTDLKDLQAQFAAAKAASEDLQAKLAQAGAEIALLKKPPVKK